MGSWNRSIPPPPIFPSNHFVFLTIRYPVSLLEKHLLEFLLLNFFLTWPVALHKALCPRLDLDMTLPYDTEESQDQMRFLQIVITQNSSSLLRILSPGYEDNGCYFLPWHLKSLYSAFSSVFFIPGLVFHLLKGCLVLYSKHTG